MKTSKSAGFLFAAILFLAVPAAVRAAAPAYGELSDDLFKGVKKEMKDARATKVGHILANDPISDVRNLRPLSVVKADVDLTAYDNPPLDGLAEQPKILGHIPQGTRLFVISKRVANEMINPVHLVLVCPISDRNEVRLTQQFWIWAGTEGSVLGNMLKNSPEGRLILAGKGTFVQAEPAPDFLILQYK